MPALRTPPARVNLLIRNGVVVTMESARTILYDGATAIADGRVVALGSAEQLAGCYVADRTINTRHKAVLPGVIDTHHHFLQNFLKGSMKIALRIAPVVKMLQAGVNISLGTDNHIVNNPVYCATAASDVATVIVEGQLMVEDGKLLCCDEQDAVAEAEEFALRRFAQASLEMSPYYCQC